ncbi:MAG TPA: hypothetical protein VLT85_08175 [Terriglobales bacterium]|nr:hypothetical protein [Terriglobales bacterium]
MPPRNSRPRRLLIVSLVLAGGFLAQSPAGAGFVPPKTYPAQTYPARDDHKSEQVSIAADPYDMPDKAAIFRVPYKDAGFLPIQLIVTNDGGQELDLRAMKVEFVTVHRDKRLPAVPEDIYRRIARQGARPDQPSRNPLPFPRKKVKPSVSKEDKEEIESAGFAWSSVPPHSTRAGFLFFDVQDIANPLAGGMLYVSGVTAGGKELFYFSIPMEKYLTYQPGAR